RERGLDARAERAEGVEALGARELLVFFLQVARGDVVGAGVAEDRPLLADDDGQLAFVIDALRLRRADDRAVWRQDRAGRLQEDDRLGRRVVAQLLRMIRVVAPDRDDLRRRDGREELERRDQMRRLVDARAE